MAMISVFGSCVGPEELEEVRDCFERQWMGIGPKVKAFEQQMARRLGTPDFALVNSGSNALYMAVKLLNLPPGSEVIVPAFTWIACAHAVVLCGCKPVFCDVDLDTHNVTGETVERAITPQTRAIMVVHYGGKPVRMEEILPFGLPVIEDAAHAVDSRLCGQPCGAIGTVGIFSFDSIKNVAMGEGGGVVARDPELVAHAKLLRYCGIGKSGFEASVNKDRWWEYHVTDFFPKMLPDDIAAGIGLAQLRKLDRLQARRKAIWELYQREFADLPWLVRPQDPAPDEQHSYFTYCVRVLGDGSGTGDRRECGASRRECGASRRDAFAKSLYAQEIYTTLRYHPLHLNAVYGSSAHLPNCEQLNEEGLSLPIHPRLSDEDVERIVTAVKGFGSRR